MEKDSLSTVALIGLLLVMIIVALYVKKEQELVVVRPGENDVVSKTLATLDQEASKGVASCGEGCVPRQEVKLPDSQKKAYQADPVPRIQTLIEKKYKDELQNNELKTEFFVQDQLWWRSDKEQYRILVDNAKTFGVEVNTTSKANELAPKDPGEIHPAIRHPLLKKVNKEIDKQMKNLGYKPGNFETCPVKEAHDPFNNCVATYTKDEQMCSLTAGYGPLDKQKTEQSMLRIELSCSKSYQNAYKAALPYLFTLNIVSPEWLVSDMAVYKIENEGDWSRVSFGKNYGIFQKIENGWRLVAGGDQNPTCQQVKNESIPMQIYKLCD